MVKRRRWLSLALALAFAVGLAFAPSAAAVCAATVTGTLFVPTGLPNPPPFATPTVNHGVNAWFAFTIYPGDTYELDAVATITTECLFVCVNLADFNIAFFQFGSPFDALLADHDTVGNQGGNIPTNADYALVYMVHGPDLLGSDSSAGAKFTLGMDC